MKQFEDIIKNTAVSLIECREDGMAFILKTDTANLLCIVSNGLGWDHVSVSLPGRPPRYQEMKAVKRICFAPDEWAMELHPPVGDYISVNNNVLHIWRPQNADIPIPPRAMV